MALNAKRSPAVPVETVPISTNAEHEELDPSIRSDHKKSESAEGFEILDDTEGRLGRLWAKVTGLPG
jgi:hypothetical protein